MDLNDNNLDLADPKWQDGCAWGLAMGAITGGVAGGIGGTGYTIGKGGIYLTTQTIGESECYVETDNIYADLKCGIITAEEAANIMKNLFNTAGMTDISTESDSSGVYVTGKINNITVKFGPLDNSSSTGKLSVYTTWYVSIYAGNNLITKYSGTVINQGNDVYRFPIRYGNFEIAGYSIPVIYSLSNKGDCIYKLGNTNFTMVNGTAYLNDVEAKNVIEYTHGYSNAFDSDYLKLFCNPMLYTPLERKVTGCYPVKINGVETDSLIISRFRSYLAQNSFLVVKEVSSNFGFLTCSHVISSDTYSVFPMLDTGEQYATYVDDYLEARFDNLTMPYLATEGGE